jgi:hypothetical protein
MFSHLSTIGVAEIRLFVCICAFLLLHVYMYTELRSMVVVMFLT